MTRRRSDTTFGRRVAAYLLLAMLPISGCSIERLAINSLSGVLAEGGSIFERDNDPELIAEALPFSLKLMDTLLQEQPNNVDLLLAAASGYVFYCYASVSTEAERISGRDIVAARAMRDRASNLYLRAHEYAARALAVDYPEVSVRLASAPESALQQIRSGSDRTVELLYWNAASLGLAISSARNEPALLARSGEVEALLNRAIELDDTWDDGSLHEFAINAASLTGIDRETIDMHFEQALDLSGGKRAALFVTYAEATAVPSQDRAAFVELLERALAVPVESFPELTLLNTVAQQRAAWLMGQLDFLFLE
jgi:hypothetical protein